jgi:uncharacterized protein
MTTVVPKSGSTAAAPILLALLVVALIVVPIANAGDWPQLAGMATALAVATAWAVRSRSEQAIRAVLLADAMLAMVALGGIQVWPAPVVIAVALLYLLSRWRRDLCPPASYVRPGRITADVWALVVLTIAGSAVALAAWASIARPTVSPYLRWMAQQPTWLLLAGLVAFAVLNSIGEELLFRGIFLSELAAASSATLAVVATGIAFAIAHVNGFPSGWFGALMAGVYGLALGVLRVRSRGMLAPFLAHVGADITIGLLAVLLLT